MALLCLPGIPQAKILNPSVYLLLQVQKKSL